MTIIMRQKFMIILNVKKLLIIMIYPLKQIYYYWVMCLLLIEKKLYEIYGLDPLYCISAPGFSNRAMLKMITIEIMLITSVDMHLIIQDGIRGDKCEAIYYRTKANNKYVNPDFNKDNEKESYIISLDAN